MTLDILVTAVSEVAAYQRSLFGSHRLAYHDKGDLDFVTEVDHYSQDILISAIRDMSPGAGIIAEEPGADVLPEGDSALYIIDPLDGTANYLGGLGFWGVAIGVVEEGRITRGVIANSQTGVIATSDAGVPSVNGAHDLGSVHFYCTDRSFEGSDLSCIAGKRRQMGASVPAALALLGGGARGKPGFDIVMFGTAHLWDVAGSAAVLKKAGGAALLATGEELTDSNLFDLIGPVEQWRNWQAPISMSGSRPLAKALVATGLLRDVANVH